MKAWECGVIAGTVGYVVLFCLSKVITPRIPGLSHHYEALTAGGRAEWNSRVPSTIHAWMVVLGCYYAALFSNEHLNDRVVYYDDRLHVPYGLSGLGPEFFMALFLGYLAADLVLVCMYRDEVDFFPFMVVHHIFAGLVWASSIFMHGMQWYTCFMMFAEMSTPITNLRWWMLSCKVPETSVGYLLVSSWMFTTFFMARILTIPFILYLFLRYDAVRVYADFGFLELSVLLVALLVNCVLQGYWWSLMVKGMMEKFFGENAGAAETEALLDAEAQRHRQGETEASSAKGRMLRQPAATGCRGSSMD
jgi:hypothetical protein